MNFDIKIPIRSPNIRHRIRLGFHWVLIGFKHMWYGTTTLTQKNVDIKFEENED